MGHAALHIGFLGLGTMGTPMATNLIKKGIGLTVWNRTASKAQPLLGMGARFGRTPAHVAAESDIIITMVGTPKDVKSIVLGPEGVLEGIRSGSVLVDMSTVSPATSRELAAGMATKQSEFLDAPVVGSKGPATDATLVILVGGLPTTLERCRPILSVLGKTIIHAGGVGMGSALKLSVNLMLAHLMAGFAEALLLLERSGLDPKRFLEVLEASTFRSPWYQTKGMGLIQRDFSTHFALKHMHKDLALMGELAQEGQVGLPVTEAIRSVFSKAQVQGKGELDYSAILASLEEVALDKRT